MAKRFGGEYSPGGDPRPQADRTPSPQRAVRRKRLSPVGARVHILFILPFIWAVSAFWRDPTGMVQNLGVFALMILSAWLTREGVIAQDAYDQRRIARRPAIPRKIFASVAMGLALALAGWGSDGGILNMVIFGVLGGVLHLASFGPDPLTDKAMDEIDIFQQDRVARVLVEGEAYLKAMKDAALRAGDRDITARVDRFLISARTMFRTVEEDPRDLTAARRYLGVYLMGARDATIKFADIWTRSKDQKARADFQALLTDLETNFDARTRSLLSDDKTDLEIEIDVLRDRLKREGLKTQL